MSAAEHHYICAHGHEWTTVPSDRMRCPHCGTTTFKRRPERARPFAGGLWHPTSSIEEETER